MKVVLLTTSIVSAESLSLIERLRGSILSALSSNTDIYVKHILLLQNPAKEDIPRFASLPQYELIQLGCDEMISLSEARNRMLTYCRENLVIELDDLVAFPDDDCWYPELSLWYIFELFKNNCNLDFFFTKYRQSEHDTFDESMLEYNVETKCLIQNASSNTIFLRGKLIDKVKGFDRNLGVGAIHNGGEDLDYSIRSFLDAKEIIYSGQFLIGHRDKDNSLKGKYYKGSAIVLQRYRGQSFGLLFQALRKTMIGVYLVATFQMNFKDLVDSLKTVENDSVY